MTFAACVLVVVVLYWAQAIFVPFALAHPFDIHRDAAGNPARALGRRVPAVLVTVTLVFIAFGFAGWGVARQMAYLGERSRLAPAIRVTGRVEYPTVNRV